VAIDALHALVGFLLFLLCHLALRVLTMGVSLPHPVALSTRIR